MARPTKTGLDYFPLTVDMGDEIKLIEAEFKMTGFAVIIKILQKIYKDRGYYCKWTNEVALLFSSENGLSGSVVSEIVRASIKRGIFDKSMFNRYKILTSKKIQEIYFEAVKRRIGIEAEEAYLLVEVSPKTVSVVNNVIIVNNNSINTDRNTQKKEKEKKEKKIKEKVPADRNVGYSFSSSDPDMQEVFDAAKEAGMRFVPEMLRDVVASYGSAKTIDAIDNAIASIGFVSLSIVKNILEDWSNREAEQTKDDQEMQQHSMEADRKKGGSDDKVLCTGAASGQSKNEGFLQVGSRKGCAGHSGKNGAVRKLDKSLLHKCSETEGGGNDRTRYTAERGNHSQISSADIGQQKEKSPNAEWNNQAGQKA